MQISQIRFSLPLSLSLSHAGANDNPAYNAADLRDSSERLFSQPFDSPVALMEAVMKEVKRNATDYGRFKVIVTGDGTAAAQHIRDIAAGAQDIDFLK